MKVIGIDLSLTGTGVSDGAMTVLIASKGKAADGVVARRDRLVLISRAVRLYGQTADLVVIEQPAYASTTGHMHDRSGLWWLVVDGLLSSGVQVVEVAPSALKRYSTGKGNCPKGDVLDAAYKRLPGVDTGGNDNRADALWLAAMGYAHLGEPLCDMPAVSRSALLNVRWEA